MEIRFGRRHAACLVALMVAGAACAAGEDDVGGAGRDLEAAQALRDMGPNVSVGAEVRPDEAMPGETTHEGGTIGGTHGGTPTTGVYVCLQPMPMGKTPMTSVPGVGATMTRAQLLDRACGAVIGTLPDVLRDAASVNTDPAMTGMMSYTGMLLGALGTGAQCFPSVRVESDAEIAGILDVMSRQEIVMSRFVDERTDAARVRDFARLMIMSHSLAIKEQSMMLGRLGIMPEDSTYTRTLTTSLIAWMRTVDVTYTPRLDLSFMDRQVESHLTALQLIDALRPQARYEQTRMLLEQARMMTTEHFVYACEQRASITGQAGVFDQGEIDTPTTAP